MQKSSLDIIQKISKISAIASKVIFIVSIVCGVLCAVGVFDMLFLSDDLLSFGGVTLKGLVDTQGEADTKQMTVKLALYAVVCICTAVNAKFSSRYFNDELEAGTPFTLDGARDMLRLGIATVSISMAEAIICTTTYQIFQNITHSALDFEMNDPGSIVLGIAFIVISFVLRYGAEICTEKSKKKERK